MAWPSYTIHSSFIFLSILVIYFPSRCILKWPVLHFPSYLALAEQWDFLEVWLPLWNGHILVFFLSFLGSWLVLVAALCRNWCTVLQLETGWWSSLHQLPCFWATSDKYLEACPQILQNFSKLNHYSCLKNGPLRIYSSRHRDLLLLMFTVDFLFLTSTFPNWK